MQLLRSSCCRQLFGWYHPLAVAGRSCWEGKFYRGTLKLSETRGYYLYASSFILVRFLYFWITLLHNHGNEATADGAVASAVSSGVAPCEAVSGRNLFCYLPPRGPCDLGSSSGLKAWLAKVGAVGCLTNCVCYTP